MFKRISAAAALIAATMAAPATANEYLNFIAHNTGKVGAIGHQLRLSDSQTYLDQDCGEGSWFAVAYIGGDNHWVPVEVGCWTELPGDRILISMTDLSTYKRVPQSVMPADAFVRSF